MTADVPTLGVGIALLALGVDWRIRAVRRRHADFRDRVCGALDDPDPVARRAAVGVIVQHGLSAIAGLLLDAIAKETDFTVLDAIAEAVARNQWEPSDRPHVFELRLWAARRFEEQAEHRRLDEGPQRTPEQTAPLAEPGSRQFAEAESGGAHAPAANGHGPPATHTQRRRLVAQIAADALERVRGTGAREDSSRRHPERRP
jgi:hypothetical protein